MEDVVGRNGLLQRLLKDVMQNMLEAKMEGYNDILGIWIGEAEGVKDILIACMDGLKGLPDAIKTAFPDVSIQNCIIHQIRNSIKYVASKDKKEFMKDLKCVYKASTEELAITSLDTLKDKWDKLSTYFKYSPEIRKIIYTTNALEGFNRQLRKFTKTRTVFPTDEALRKSLYLATEKVMEKWTSPSPNWGLTLAQLTIVFKDKVGEEII